MLRSPRWVIPSVTPSPSPILEPSEDEPIADADVSMEEKMVQEIGQEIERDMRNLTAAVEPQAASDADGKEPQPTDKADVADEKHVPDGSKKGACCFLF